MHVYIVYTPVSSRLSTEYCYGLSFTQTTPEIVINVQGGKAIKTSIRLTSVDFTFGIEKTWYYAVIFNHRKHKLVPF